MGTIFTHRFRHTACQDFQQPYKLHYCRCMSRGVECQELHRDSLFRLMKDLDAHSGIPYILLPHNDETIQDLTHQIQYMLDTMGKF